MAKRNDTTGSTVAMLGGGALLAWFLLGGTGLGLGRRSGAGVARAGDAATNAHGPMAAALAAPCRVHVVAAGVELDGALADLPTVVRHCRASGTADVTTTGAAIVRTVAETVSALQVAGVTVHAEAAVWDAIDAGVRRTA